MMAFFLFLTSLIVYFASASNADAGPVFFAALSGGAGFGAAFAATSLGSFLTTTFTGRLLASVALSALQTAFMPKPKTPGITTEVTATGGTNPCGFILGKSATAGDAVCPMMSHGKVGKTPNAYLTYVVALGDVAGQSLTRVAIDGAYVSLGTTPHADYGLPVLGKYDGYAWVKYYDGSQTAADPMLLAKYGTYPERPWQADMIGTGIPYAICTFRFNRELFQSLPAMLFECGGIKLYDPRKDSTAGGSGAHRWGNAATYEATTNSAVLTYNILRGITLPALGVWGGRIEAEDLPAANMFAAMNECDITVGSPAQAQYQAGFEVRVDMEPASVIEELLKGCTGQLAEIGGVFKMRVGGPGLPVMFITDDDIITTKSQDFDPFPQADQRQNGLDAKYPDPEAIWQPKAAPSLYNTAWELEDGDRRVTSLDMPACPFPLQVQRVMAAYSKDERRFRKHGLTLPPDAAVLEPLDTISWTSTRNGYDAKLFELSEVVDDTKSLLQRVSMRECDYSDYDWVAGTLPYIASAIRVVPGAQKLPAFGCLPATIVDGTSSARRPGVRLVWTAADLDAVDAVQYEVRIKNGPVIKRGDVVDVAGGEIICVEGILGNVIYQARAKPVARARATDWSDWVDVTSPDIRLGQVDLSDGLNQTIADISSTADQALLDAGDVASDLVALQVATATELTNLRNLTRAWLNGWVKDPTFADWTSGNLTAANYTVRSGTGTVGTQFVGDFGGGIYINAAAGAAQTYAYPILFGADPDASHVVVSMLVEVLSGLAGGNIRVGWSNNGTSWTYAAGATTLAGYGIGLKPSVDQYVERIFARPAGTFSQMRLEIFFKTSSDGAQETKWHLVNLRAATEAEIRASNVPTMQSGITTNAATLTTLTGTVASLDTRLSSKIAGVQRQAILLDWVEGDLNWVAGQVSTRDLLQTAIGPLAAYGAAASLVSVAGIGPVFEVTAAANAQLSERMVRPVVTGQKMRLRLRGRNTNAVSGARFNLYLAKHDENGTYVGLKYVGFFPLGIGGAWETPEIIITPSDYPADLPGGNYRFFLNNSYASGATVQMQWLSIEDVTDAEGIKADIDVNYLTAAETNSAIAAVQTSLGASIGSAQGTIDQIKALNLSGTTAFGTLMTQLQVNAGGTSVKFSETVNALATVEGNMALTYSLKLGSSGLTIIESDNPNGPASTAVLAAQHIKLMASSVSISAPSNIFPDFDMLDANFYAMATAGSYLFATTTSNGLGLQYIYLAVNAAATEANSGWFTIDAAQTYLVSAAAWLNSGDASGGAVSIEFGSLAANGLVTPISSTTVKTAAAAGFNATTSFAEISVAAPANARRARFKITRTAGGTGVLRAGGFKMRQKATAALLVDGIFSVTGMAAFGGTLQSSNFVTGVSGWRITQAGGIEANSLTVRSSMIVDGRTIVYYENALVTSLDTSLTTGPFYPGYKTLASITTTTQSKSTTLKFGFEMFSLTEGVTASFNWHLRVRNSTFKSGMKTLATGSVSSTRADGGSGDARPPVYAQAVAFEHRDLPIGSSISLEATNIVGDSVLFGILTADQIKLV